VIKSFANRHQILSSLLIGIFIALTSIQIASAEEIYDPLEGLNRKIFWFNDKFDRYLLEPVAKGYDKVMPEEVQDAVDNVFENLAYPKYLLSDLVQLKGTQALHHTARFLINTTIGLVGIFDVANEMGLEPHKEDFGIALAYHDVPPGPYLVLPFIGPSNLRDGLGRLVDFFLSPSYMVGYADLHWNEEWAISSGIIALDFVRTRASLLDAVDAGKEASFDFYFFSQSAYYQYRAGVLYDGDVPEEEEFEEGVASAPVSPDIDAADPRPEVPVEAILHKRARPPE
jgi:phospholipid-binding lipoprotein MlaA